ncbi:hypothetical protein REV77_004899 [Klebsiella aerogenes]|nr:hypothetical protein [Klebsiella aerogenes]
MDFVEKNYGKLPTQQIADFLGRGIPAIRAMALKLGVGRTGAKPWSPAEIEVVKKYYSHGAGVVMVQTLLPHRDKESIRKQAAKAGVTDARDWHPDAIKFLKEHYGHMDVEDIATTLNKTVSAVRNRATVLKLGKERLRKWTPEENAILTSEHANSDNLNEIHALLPHRSRRAIATQATKLGLKRAEDGRQKNSAFSDNFIRCRGEKLSRCYQAGPLIRFIGRLKSKGYDDMPKRYEY